jgi:Holliday junction resolvase-like predicted endonuclease
VKRKVKNIREVELKKKKGGWFNRGDNELTQQEQEELERYIDTSMEGETSKRDPSCILLRVNMELRGGRMVLVEHKG